MSSTLKPLTLGRKPEDGQDRAAMLSRLGIAEAPQDEIYREAEPEPAPQVEALAAPPPEERPMPTPALDRLRAWASPANDERVPTVDEKPALAIPAPPPEVEVEEDPFEAIRERYRNPPKGMTLPAGISIPTSLPSMPKVPIKMAPVGERRRKAGELSMVRKVIWGLTWLAAGMVGWALLTADANSPIIQAFGALLP